MDKSLKIFVACLSTETNTFAAIPTGLSSFEEAGLFHGDGSERAPKGAGNFAHFVRLLAQADGHQVIESITAVATPGGCTVRSAYESLRDELISDLKAAGSVDVVILLLHGAMVAEGYDDCEGDLLSRVREVVGPETAIGAELDLHCHFTALMKDVTDAIVCFKEYPHTDENARARELYNLLTRTALRQIRPTTAVFDCKMVGVWHTTREPMISFVNKMKDLESSGRILSASLGHGFPWGDVAEGGAKVWVITDNDPRVAEDAARQLGQEFWDLRDQTGVPILDIDSAIDRALISNSGPIVLADVADNPGGGAPGDSTFILRRLLMRNVEKVVAGAFWDLGAVRICSEAGVGAELDLRLGGKCGPTSGDPLDLKVTVRAIRKDHSQQTFGGCRQPLGISVWAETASGVHLLICSVRDQIMGTDAFTGLGISLHDKKIICVKSTHHFYENFSDLAGEILYVSTPGAISPDFASIPYKKRDLNYWPRIRNPHEIVVRKKDKRLRVGRS